MKKVLIPIIPLVLLISCISTDTEINLGENGSGRINLNYTVSTLVSTFGSLEEDPLLPLPVEEEDFRNTVNRSEGLSLNSYSRKEDEDTVQIEVSLNFDSIEDLNQLYGAGEQAVGISQENGMQVFSQVIFVPPREGIDPKTQGFAENFFSDYELSFEISPPETIESVSLGDIIEDGRTAAYTISITELLRAEEPIIWEVRW